LHRLTILPSAVAIRLRRGGGACCGGHLMIAIGAIGLG
jgi:hypothetical protein